MVAVKADDSRRAAAQPPAIGAHAVPSTSGARGGASTTAVEWVRPRAARRQWLCGPGGACHGGAGAMAMETKACRRRGGAWSWSTVSPRVFLIYGD